MKVFETGYNVYRIKYCFQALLVMKDFLLLPLSSLAVVLARLLCSPGRSTRRSTRRERKIGLNFSDENSGKKWQMCITYLCN
jgi:hypothetical protein